MGSSGCDRIEVSEKPRSPEAPSLSFSQSLPNWQDQIRNLYHVDSRTCLPLLDIQGLPGTPGAFPVPGLPAGPPADTLPNWRTRKESPFGKPAREDISPRPPDTSPPGPRVKFDDAGYVTDIQYPGNKSRRIERDPQTHQAATITTRTADATTTLKNRDGKWFLQVQGLELPVGKMEVGKNGDVATRDSNTGVWKVEKPDGSVTEEKENSSGARVAFDSRHQVASITRKDGTTLLKVDDSTIMETHPGQAPVTWKKQEDSWKASSQDKPRKNMVLHENASLSFTDADGVKHLIDGAGQETLDGGTVGKITRDGNQRRPRAVELADSSKERQYTYFDENSRDLQSVTIKDLKKGTSVTYTRDSKDSDEWRSPQGSWRGEIQVSDDGVHLLREHKSGASVSPDSRWSGYHPDGTETSDLIAADGSRASYNKDNSLVAYLGAEGTRIERVENGGKSGIRFYDPKTSDTVSFTQGADGKWTADSGRFPQSLKDLSFTAGGEISYTDQRGARVLQKHDGTRESTEQDGTRLSFDRNNQLLKAGKGDLERSFVWENGQIKSVRDHNKSNNQDRVIFDRRPAQEETRTHVAVDSRGNLSYQNPDGTAVIERSNMLHLDLDKDGDISRVVGPKGTREFRFGGEGDRKTLLSVSDSRQTSKGEQKDAWTRVVNIDGSLSSEFRAQSQDGKALKPRFNLNPCADGEYEYRLSTDKPGDKPHVEHLVKDQGTSVAASVEEARDKLSSVLEAQMDRGRLERNLEFMKDFEQRIMDQVELRVAAGASQQTAGQEAEKCLIDTYNHCSRLAGTARGSNELYDQKTRVNLTENLLYLGAHPEDINQGKTTGTCWFEASWNVGMFQRNVDQAARFVADVALTGQYTTTAGSLNGGSPRTIKVNPDYVKIDPNIRDSGGDWTPDNASKDHRNMVGMLIDQIGPVAAGQRDWGQSRGGFHQEARDIVYMMTGKDDVRSLSDSIGRAERLRLLQSGGYTVSGMVDPRTLEPTHDGSGAGHMWAYTMHKDREGWYVLRDDQHADDRIVQRIPDLNKWLNGSVRADNSRQWR